MKAARRPYTVSVVIPTRNRPKELMRLLRSLAQQRFPLDEVIIVDASDDPSSVSKLSGLANLHVKVIVTSPSVCKQRNIGISEASSEFVFLCDDDMEVPPDYLDTLVGFLRAHPEHSAVSGLIAETNSQGIFQDSPALSARRFVWNFLFLLGAWGDLRSLRTTFANRWMVDGLAKRLLRKGNTETPAGWPVVLWKDEPYFTTRFFGLGASVIRRSLLVNSPYDENLDADGIGDNYDVALGFPGGALAVVTSTRCFHHHSPSQRSEPSIVYYRRVLALDYILGRHGLRTSARRMALLWSMVGNLIPFILHGSRDLAAATLRAMLMILKNENPYSKLSEQDTVPDLSVPGTDSVL